MKTFDFIKAVIEGDSQKVKNMINTDKSLVNIQITPLDVAEATEVIKLLKSAGGMTTEEIGKDAERTDMQNEEDIERSRNMEDEMWSEKENGRYK